ncbi:MAG TPA: thiamine pyrophosphate-binding protein [Candidatus Saccharimonadales bacterium]|nr:thiamine pyrophosphate-binding protein [Candidatus Saccharimonadales bacterium]
MTTEVDTLTAGDGIVRVLVANDLTTAFGIPGIHNLGLYDALARETRVRHFLVRHEQGAGFAADGFARVSGKPGLAIATTGPGAYNALTAISEAYLDSSPVLLLAGQIDAEFIGRNWGILHETIDQGAVFEQVTKFVGRPRTPDELPATVAAAIQSMLSGRPRPAYVEMPTDLLIRAMSSPPVSEPVAVEPVAPDPDEVERVAELLSAAKRPLIIAGTGVLRAHASAELVRLAERLDAPVMVTLSAGGAIPADHPLYAGYLISRHPAVLGLLNAADLVLIAGSRLDAQTSARWTLPLPRIVHLDVDAAVIGRIYPVEAGLVADAKPGLAALADAVTRRAAGTDPAWGTAAATRVPAAVVASLAPDRAALYGFFRDLRAAMPRNVISTHDAATINSWSGYFWPTYVPEGNIWPWGSAALGFGLPVAIGAAVAAPDQPVIAFIGDGGLGFTAMELATAVRYGLNVNVIVHNDNAFSSIGNYQLREFGRAYETDLHNPDFVPFARSFGLTARRVERWEDAAAAAAELVATPGPTLLEVAAPILPPF